MLNIAHVSVEPLTIGLHEPFGIATGAQSRADNVLVRVRLSDDTVGWGEAAPFPAVSGETQGLVMSTLTQHVEGFAGRPIDQWRRLCREAAERLSASASATCALQCALLDAWLRSHHCSMWSFFGGTDRVLQSDITIPTGSVAAATLSAQRAVGSGFVELKVKVGGSELAHDVERLRAIALAAPNASLLLDANGAFSADEAIELLNRSGDARSQIGLFEQPTPPDDLEGLRSVMVQGKVPVAADESARSGADVLAIAQQRAASVINIKIMKSGVLEALDMITIAKQHHLKLMIGGMVESQLAMSVSACIAAGLGGFAWIDLDTPLFMHPVFINGSALVGGFERSQSWLCLDVIEAGHGVQMMAQRPGSVT